HFPPVNACLEQLEWEHFLSPPWATHNPFNWAQLVQPGYDQRLVPPCDAHNPLTRARLGQFGLGTSTRRARLDNFEADFRLRAIPLRSSLAPEWVRWAL
ncbi:hypothetical protein PF010_g24062, partial [Phytophthora fragariae]